MMTRTTYKNLTNHQSHTSKAPNFMLGVITAVWILFFGLIPALAQAQQATANGDKSESLKNSLVYLKFSQYPYDQFRPWKQTEVSEITGYGTAVGENLVLTTAALCADTTLVKARIAGQNEFISASITVVDYELNLALLTLDKSALKTPLTPITFADEYPKGASLDFYWLNPTGQIFNGRGYLDRAEMRKSLPSFSQTLNFVIANITQDAGSAELYFDHDKPIAIGCRFDSDGKEAWAIPAGVINRFLDNARNGNYQGFGAVGFESSSLLDPHLRTFLKMPADLNSGVYITRVYTLGTACNVLQPGDVLLAIDNHTIDAWGKFKDPVFQDIDYKHLITSTPIGKKINLDIWRNGQKIADSAPVSRFNADEMLVPYYEFGRQPEYIVTAGCIFQTLTRSYMAQIGRQWESKITPQFFAYYTNQAFAPTFQRQHIVILSYVLPDDVNQGYHSLRQIVLKSVNGKPISTLADILDAKKLNPDAPFDIFEFENTNPTLVIPRNQIDAIDAAIAKRYGITQPVMIRQSAQIGAAPSPQ